VTSNPAGHGRDPAVVLRDARLGDLRWVFGEERAEYDALPEATRELFELLERRKIPFVLVGGLAIHEYVSGRNTRDIDIVIAPKDLARLPELREVHRAPDFVRLEFRGVLVDALLTTNKLFDGVRRRHSATLTIGECEIPCATPAGLILMKLYAIPSLYRQQDFDRLRVYQADVAQLMFHARPDMEALLSELEPHVVPTDLMEIRRIVEEILADIARFESQPLGTTDEPGRP
jgi:hypothetical protein